MTSRVNWGPRMTRQFIEPTDYVNLGPVRIHKSDSQNRTARRTETYGCTKPVSGPPHSTQSTPYSRPITGIKPMLQAQNFFASSSSIIEDDSQNVSEKVAFRPLLEAKLPKDSLDTSSEQDISGGSLLPRHVGQKFVTNQPGLHSSAKKPLGNQSGLRQKNPLSKQEPQDFKRILIGSVEHVIRWHNTARAANLSFLYEAIGTLENWKHSKWDMLLFLRGDHGHIIQGQYFCIDHELPHFENGTTLSMIGRMTGSHRMRVVEATEIPQERKPAVQRLAFLCQRMLNIAAGQPPDMSL